MISAVFHSPLNAHAIAAASSDKKTTSNAAHLIASSAHKTGVVAANDGQSKAPVVKKPWDFSYFWLNMLPPVFGLILLALLWEAVSLGTKASIPSPKDTLVQAITIFSDPV